MKRKLKILIDILMTVLLLFLMAYQIIGQKLHEYCGAAMLTLFLLHHILNVKWYRNLCKGKYKATRVFSIFVNFALLVVMLCLGFSGIVMSKHAFAFLSIHGPMATARMMHVAASYWGFVLMSVHLGLHWGMVMGLFRNLLKGKKMPALLRFILRLAAFAFAGYGAVCFKEAKIVSYMFLKNQFVFFDFEKSAVWVFAEHIAMMGLWIFIGYYIAKGLGWLSHRKQKRKNGYEAAKGTVF